MKNRILAIVSAVVLGVAFIAAPVAAAPHTGNPGGNCDEYNGPNKVETSDGSIVLEAGVIFCVKQENSNTGTLVADGVTTLAEYAEQAGLNPGVSNYVTYGRVEPSLTPTPSLTSSPSPTPTVTTTPSPTVTPSGTPTPSVQPSPSVVPTPTPSIGATPTPETPSPAPSESPTLTPSVDRPGVTLPPTDTVADDTIAADNTLLIVILLLVVAGGGAILLANRKR